MRQIICEGKNAQTQKRYQMMAYIGAERDGIDDQLFARAVRVIYDWVRSQAAGAIALPELPATVSGSDFESGKSVAVIYEPEQSFFTLRFSVTQADGTRISTEAEIRPYEKKLILAVRVIAFLPASLRRKPEADPPEFLPALLAAVGLNDGRAISGKPWYVSSYGVDGLLDFLVHGERRLPVVVISQAKNPGIGDNGYALNVRRCAAMLAGIAHVAAVDWSATYDLSEIAGIEWSCFNGAVRIYWPGGICMDTDDPYGHPLFTWKRIDEIARDLAFEDYLRDMLCRHNMAQSVDWSRYGIEFYIDAEQTRMPVQEQGEAPEKTIQRYREQLARTRESMEEFSALADEYYGDLLACREDCALMRKQMTALTRKINQQRMEIAALKHGVAEEIPVNLEYKDMESWVERYFPDRLYLHPRALRALKDATYQNPSMVYRCLVLLAEDYHEYRTGGMSRETFLKKCSLVDPGLSESAVGDSGRGGEQADEYYIMYGGRRCLLDRHLKKGVSHNPMYCLRIYFFWDAKNALVVIGSLPGHLRSALT